MKNVFKKALCLLTASLMLILCACNNSAENNSSWKENEATLETILGADKINFDANYVQVNVYSDTYSFFTNRNKDFYKTKNVKAVVMACNTTSAAVYEDLKNKVDFILYPLVQNACENIAALKANSAGVDKSHCDAAYPPARIT